MWPLHTPGSRRCHSAGSHWEGTEAPYIEAGGKAGREAGNHSLPGGWWQNPLSTKYAPAQEPIVPLFLHQQACILDHDGLIRPLSETERVCLCLWEQGREPGVRLTGPAAGTSYLNIYSGHTIF